MKLNNEVISQFKTCLAKGTNPKLVVKDGNFTIKISDELVFPCTKIPDRPTLDVYSGNNDGYVLEGRIDSKLTVLTDPKQIRDHLKTMSHHMIKKDVANMAVKKTSSEVPQLSTSAPTSPLNTNPYAVDMNDFKADIMLKFLSLLALGPTTKEAVVKKLKVSSQDLDSLFTSHAQIYNPNDSFISDDNFPNEDLESDEVDHYILKDKSYKDLKPWSWNWYSERERHMIINNIHNALTRLGYLETHPLRKKICDEPAGTNNANQRRSTLGGGILISKTKKSPMKRSQTESPRPPSEAFVAKSADRPKQSGSPLKTTQKRKMTTSASNSDEDRSYKKKKTDSDSHTSPSSSINDDDSQISINDAIDTMGKNRAIAAETDEDHTSHKRKRFQYYSTLADKFKEKYKEYETLYNSLKSNPKNSTNDKKQLVRLFELHNNLSEWKRKLWDFDNENKLKLNIMNLSKHKKIPSKSASSNSTPIIPQVVPLASDSIINRRNGSNHSRNNPIPKLTLDY